MFPGVVSGVSIAGLKVQADEGILKEPFKVALRVV